VTNRWSWRSGVRWCVDLERTTGFEPATLTTLARSCSTRFLLDELPGAMRALRPRKRRWAQSWAQSGRPQASVPGCPTVCQGVTTGLPIGLERTLAGSDLASIRSGHWSHCRRRYGRLPRSGEATGSVDLCSPSARPGQRARGAGRRQRSPDLDVLAGKPGHASASMTTPDCRGPRRTLTTRSGQEVSPQPPNHGSGSQSGHRDMPVPRSIAWVEHWADLGLLPRC
jgi:hypothetical protein